MTNCCGRGNVLLLACSGGSNVGQISNDAVKALDQLGQGSFFCLIGIGAQLPSFLEGAGQEDKVLVAIDGCGVGCAKRALQNAGLKADIYKVVTELGIEKGHHFDYTGEEVGLVAQAVADALAAMDHVEEANDDEQGCCMENRSGGGAAGCGCNGSAG